MPPRARVPASRRGRRPRSSATRRADSRQPALPFRPGPRTGATKVRPDNAPPALGRRVTRLLVALTGAILLVNAVLGDRGLLETVRVRPAHQALARDIVTLRAENRRLAREAARLRDDPSAIEALARGELGLIRPGERLFILTDDAGPDAGPPHRLRPRR